MRHLVLFHWDTPAVIEHEGGWSHRDTACKFADYAQLMAAHFGERIGQWATLNEPWRSAFLGYCSGYFSPGRTEPAVSLEAVYNIILGYGFAVNAMRDVGATNIGIVRNVIPCLAESPDIELETEHIDGMQNRIFLDLLAGRGVSEKTRESCQELTNWGFVRAQDNAVLASAID